MIGFREAGYTRNGRVLVGPVTLTVKAGEVVVLLGASGAGKTTTLRLANGLILPTAGAVLVEDRPTAAWDGIRLRRRMGYMIQETGLLPHLSVAANIGLLPRLEGWPPDRIASRIAHLLDLVGLEPALAARYPHTLSGGQSQRVGVARALALDPPILLCDEPFGAVDPVTRRALRREFSRLVRDLGKTVVFVTHDVREAEHLATRIAVLDAGAVVFAGPPEAFRTSVHPVVRALQDDDRQEPR